MTDTTITVPTTRGEMPVHLGGDPDRPLVVLFMDAPGIRPALHDHARRLVAHGYRTALPDLYYALDPEARPRPERLAAGDRDEFARMGAAVAQLRDDEVLADTEAMLKAPELSAREWSCVGFCAGARFGLRAAARFGDSVRAAALLHPSRLVTDEPDSPHRTLAGARSALYLAFGENDHVTPLATLPPLEAELESHGIPHQVEIIPGAEHGFTMPGMPAYDEAAAERAWRGTLGLLSAELGTGR